MIHVILSLIIIFICFKMLLDTMMYAELLLILAYSFRVVLKHPNKSLRCQCGCVCSSHYYPCNIDCLIVHVIIHYISTSYQLYLHISIWFVRLCEGVFLALNRISTKRRTYNHVYYPRWSLSAVFLTATRPNVFWSNAYDAPVLVNLQLSFYCISSAIHYSFQIASISVRSSTTLKQDQRLLLISVFEIFVNIRSYCLWIHRFPRIYIDQ